MREVEGFWKEFGEFLLSALPFVLVFGFAAFSGFFIHYSEYKQQLKMEKTKKQVEQVIYRSCDLKRIVKEGEKLKEGESELFSFAEFCKPAKVQYDGESYNLLLLYRVAGVKVKKVDHGILLLTPAYIGKNLNSWEKELGKITGKYISLLPVKEVLLDSDLVKNPKVVISDSFEVVR